MNTLNEDQSSPQAYQAMAEAVRDSMAELLVPFHAVNHGPGDLPPMSADEFFQKFLVYADKFTDKCCQDFSRVLRQASRQPEMRGMPTLQLAKQVRLIAFEGLDKILLSYVEALTGLHMDLRQVTNSLADSSVLGEALRGAAIGQVAGGLGQGGKLLGTIGALAAAGNEATKQQALLDRQRQIELESKNLAFAKIVEYLRAVEAMPENLLDYGCAKCFGGELDFAKQNAALEVIQAPISEQLRLATDFTLKLQRLEVEKMDQFVLQQAAQKAQATKSFDKGFGGCLVAVGGVSLLGAVGALTSQQFADAALAGFMFAIVLLGVGVYVLSKKK
jgi:hypothetical protein